MNSGNDYGNNLTVNIFYRTKTSIPKAVKGCLIAPGKKKTKRLTHTVARTLTLETPHKRRNYPNRYIIRRVSQNRELPEADNTMATRNACINGTVSTPGTYAGLERSSSEERNHKKTLTDEDRKKRTSR